MSFVVIQFLTGLASASSLFLVACGLSIIFGVTRIVNFAHGSFYMLGGYLAITLTGLLMPLLDGLGFWIGILAAGLIAGCFGVAMEILLLRRLYRSDELFPLLATFAVVLIIQDLALAVWGPEDILGPPAPGLAGFVTILDGRLPTYDLFLIGIGPLILLLIWLLFHKTRWGILVRAATEDREMVAALGVDQKRLFTSVVFLGTALAGIGGALQLPREAINLGMDLNVIAEAFVVVVVGGMGSILGPFLAAVLIAQLSAFGILVFPQITIVLLFAVMAVVLIVRPQGLLGRPTTPHQGRRTVALAAPKPSGKPLRLAGAIMLASMLGLPLLADGYQLGLMSEIIIFALFAASLQMLLGVGGLISFGHAAYLGLGAYGAALLVKHFAMPMEGALLAAPLTAGLGAFVFGWFCVRLSGVYLAMLTLAFAQIAWSVAFQWTAVTGGDNGILGVWPSDWAASPGSFFYLTLALACLAWLCLRRTAFSPFGYILRAARDSEMRAEAIGIDPRHQRWLAFVLAGVVAGLAGGLYAFLKGSVFPDAMAIPTSVDGLVMVLLGGVGWLEGPLLGAAVFTGLKAELVTLTNLWRLIVGTVVILLVLAFPHGLMSVFGRAVLSRNEDER